MESPCWVLVLSEDLREQICPDFVWVELIADSDRVYKHLDEPLKELCTWAHLGHALLQQFGVVLRHSWPHVPQSGVHEPHPVLRCSLLPCFLHLCFTRRCRCDRAPCGFSLSTLRSWHSCHPDRHCSSFRVPHLYVVCRVFRVQDDAMLRCLQVGRDAF